MAHLFDRRIISQPHRVWWAGFETTTARMQQAGWNLSAEEDHMRGAVRLAMRHEPLKLYGVSEPVEHYYGRMTMFEQPLEFHVRHMASRFEVSIHTTAFNFKPIDAYPQMLTRERRSIEDFNIFATPLVRTEEIIVDPNDVQAMLDHIRKLQAPEQADIRARNAARERRERYESVPQQQFHAQILSFARAA